MCTFCVILREKKKSFLIAIALLFIELEIFVPNLSALFTGYPILDGECLVDLIDMLVSDLL